MKKTKTTGKPKKTVKPAEPKSTFSQLLYEKLKASGLGECEHDKLSDGSCTWVGLKIGNKKLEISFDTDGETITDVGVWKDVYKVIDVKRTFGEVLT